MRSARPLFVRVISAGFASHVARRRRVAPTRAAVEMNESGGRIRAGSGSTTPAGADDQYGHHRDDGQRDQQPGQVKQPNSARRHKSRESPLHNPAHCHWHLRRWLEQYAAFMCPTGDPDRSALHRAGKRFPIGVKRTSIGGMGQRFFGANVTLAPNGLAGFSVRTSRWYATLIARSALAALLGALGAPAMLARTSRRGKRTNVTLAPIGRGSGIRCAQLSDVTDHDRELLGVGFRGVSYS